MPISEIENEIPALKEQVRESNLGVLLPLLEKIEQSAATFNIHVTKSLLDEVIEKTKK